MAALAQVSQQFDPRDTASLGLQGWDLQQLALYLLVSTLMCIKVVEGKVIEKITNKFFEEFTKCFLLIEIKTYILKEIGKMTASSSYYRYMLFIIVINVVMLF